MNERTNERETTELLLCVWDIVGKDSPFHLLSEMIGAGDYSTTNK